MKKIKIYLITLLVFFAIDAVWLGFISPALYEKEIGSLLGDPILLPAIIFYLVYPYALMELAILSGLKDKNSKEAAYKGALLGFIAYGTYDLTNMAVLAGWSPLITVVDMIWGTILSLAVTAISLNIARRIK